uniref:Uncharacterized protein n=1 Tax=Arundo donax TaxID=35708 RepID=A0A0A9AH09_ARUDO
MVTSPRPRVRSSKPGGRMSTSRTPLGFLRAQRKSVPASSSPRASSCTSSMLSGASLPNATYTTVSAGCSSSHDMTVSLLPAARCSSGDRGRSPKGTTGLP